MNTELPEANKTVSKASNTDDLSAHSAACKLNEARNEMRLLKLDPVSEASDDRSSVSGEQENVPTEDNQARFGEELAPDAGIWNTFIEEAQEYQWEDLWDRRTHLETVMLITVSLSVILAVFLLEAKKAIRLERNPSEPSDARLLTMAWLQQGIKLGLPAHSESSKVITTPGDISFTAARWINRAWFMSLALSLSVALLAMLGKKILTHFRLPRPQSMNNLARARHSISQIKQLEDSGALQIMDFLPVLLHVSSFLFAAGLIGSVWEFDTVLAAVLVGIAGITISLYFGTSVLAVMPKPRPRDFAAEVLQCLQRTVSTVFRFPSRGVNSEAATPPILDLQALVWLSKRTEDPIVMDRIYQAMAGLHQSPYTAPYLAHQRPDLSLKLITHDIAPLFGKGETIESLLLQIKLRFDEILTGTLENGSEEPPVCRYVNAMIALGFCLEKATNGPLEIWLNIEKKIDSLWSSNLPQQSISGNNFAGVLIAEMDVIKRLVHLIHYIATEPILVNGDDIKIGSIGSQRCDCDPQPADGFQPEVHFDKSTSDSLLRTYNRLKVWIEVSLNLLDHRAMGRAPIDSYLVDGLFRALNDGACYLKCIYEILVSRGHIHSLATPARAGIDSCLGILIFLPFRGNTHRPPSIFWLPQVLKIYSYLAPVTLRHLKKQDRSGNNNILDACGLDTKSLSTHTEIWGACVHYMMSLAACLSDLLPDFPQYEIIFNSAIHLVHSCLFEEEAKDDEAPRQAFRHHIDHYVKILEYIGASESNFGLLSRSEGLANKIGLLATYPIHAGTNPNGFYIPPPTFLTLIRVFSSSFLNERGIYLFREAIVNRLRNPSVLLAQLPPQTSILPEPAPTIHYLQQITRFADGFSALVQAGSINGNYAVSVSRAIADITIIAADHDPALTVDPVELQEPAVSSFLEAFSWALPHLPPRGVADSIFNRFVIAASVILVAACEDPESRNQISHSWARTTLLRKLQTDRGDHLEMISQEEWQRLVDGLTLGEPIAEEIESNTESDQESDDGPPGNMDSVTDSDIESDSDASASILNFL